MVYIFLGHIHRSDTAPGWLRASTMLDSYVGAYSKKNTKNLGALSSNAGR